MQWYLKVMKNYVGFSGRASRSEYWFYALFYIIFAIIVGMIDGALGMVDPETGVGTLGVIYVLIHFLPGLAVGFRRLHDTGRSGWWILINIIPLIGMLIFLFFMVIAGDDNDNEYGPSPFDVDDDDD